MVDWGRPSTWQASSFLASSRTGHREKRCSVRWGREEVAEPRESGQLPAPRLEQDRGDELGPGQREGEQGGPGLLAGSVEAQEEGKEGLGGGRAD